MYIHVTSKLSLFRVEPGDFGKFKIVVGADRNKVTEVRLALQSS